jgi:O-antigen ligase
VTKSKLSIDFAVKTIFQLLIFLLPTQLAYHFWPPWAFIFGIRVDYLAPTIFLTDILVFILLVLSLARIKIFNYKFSRPHRLKRSFGGQVIFKQKKVMLWLLMAIGLLIFIGINILNAKSIYPAIFKWLKVFEFLFLGYFVATEKKMEISGWIVKPMSLSLILFSAVGLWQLVIGHSIGGLFYFLGERAFSLSTPGIATVNYLNRDWLRVYSTFSHPNSLAGFFGVGTFMVLFTNFKSRFWKYTKYISLILGYILIFLAFSLSSYLSIFLALMFLTIVNSNRKIGKLLLYLVILLTLVFAFILPLVSPLIFSWPSIFPENISERFVLAGVAGKLIMENFLFGVGLNNYVLHLLGQNIPPQITWLLQPVHNIFLLITSETGFVGLVLFSIVIIKSVKGFRNNPVFLLAILYILLTGSTDHYWLTLQQNQLLFATILGLSFNKNNSTINSV